MADSNGSPWSASQALAWIICHKPLRLENQQWTSDMGPQLQQAQAKLAAAIGSGEVHAWGRREPHGLLERIPRDPFRISGLSVIVGEHGDMRPLSPHKQYDGPRWLSVEFEADQIKRAFPKLYISAQAWMSKNASRDQKRDSLVRDCMDATGCTKRAAAAAYNDLPDTQRRRKGKPPRNFE
jgi:hypothetical protein